METKFQEFIDWLKSPVTAKDPASPDQLEKTLLETLPGTKWLPDLEEELPEGSFSGNQTLVYDPIEEDKPEVSVPETPAPDQPATPEVVRHQTYRERGFTIAMSGDANQARAKLEALLADMSAFEAEEIERVKTLYAAFMEPYRDKWMYHQVLIAQLREKLDNHNAEIAELKLEKKRLMECCDVERANRRVLELALAEQKKDLLEKWIAEAKTRVKELLTFNNELLDEKLKTAAAIYNAHKPRNEEFVKQLVKTRDLVEDELNRLVARRNSANNEGVEKRSSRFLVASGYFLCLAAAICLSVFTSKYDFGSDDIASTIIEGLANAVQGQKAGTRILQLLELIGIVAAVSILCRSAIVHMRRGQPADSEELNEHYLQLKIKNDTIRYSGIFKAGNWTIFWLQITPLLVFAGIIFILSADKLVTPDNTMTGIALGLAIAIGLAGLVYVYILKVIEPRSIRRTKRANDSSDETNGAEGPQFKKWALHWELMAVVAFFVAVSLTILAFVFKAQESKPVFVFVSFLWSFSLCLLGAFVLAYGVRYAALDALYDELLNKKISYDDLVDQLSGPYRVEANYSLGKRADQLMHRLMGQLFQRNDIIYKDSEQIIVNERYTAFTPASKPSFFKRAKSEVKGFFGKFKQVIGDLLFPAEHPKTNEAQYKKVERDLYTAMIGWEKDFFADHSHKISICDDEIARLTEAIRKIDEITNGSANSNQEPVLSWRKGLDESIIEKENCNQRLIPAGEALTRCLRNIASQYRQAKDMISRGFELGIWYKDDQPSA